MHEKIKSCKEKGSSLIEVLFAMAILSILMVGILQMYSAAYLINQRSSVRTLQAYKCQQVAEIIRLNRQLVTNWGAIAPNDGIQFMDGFVMQLPYSDGDDFWDYWGPAGANVITDRGEPYRIFVRIEQPAGSQFFDVRVASVADSDWRQKGEPATLWGDEHHFFLGRVEYVTRIQ
jgi:prepilin-type N-terminal cleavage/methylation domain-containing protein